MQRNSEGLVYRGREDRVHIADGERANMGEELADFLGGAMRQYAAMRGDGGAWMNRLCPGCYMTAVYNMAVTLAEGNGQSLRELGRTLAGEFQRLADGEQVHVEEVRVVLDSDE